MKPPETLRTARLVLRKPTREDATLMFAAYGQDHEVAHYVTWSPHTCVPDSEAVIGRFLDLWRDGWGFHWLLFQSGGSELMGAIGVRREAHRLELGCPSAPILGLRIHERSGDSSRRLGVYRAVRFSRRRCLRYRQSALGAPAGKSWLRAGGHFTLVGGSPEHFSDAARLLLLFQSPQHLTRRCSEPRTVLMFSFHCYVNIASSSRGR